MADYGSATGVGALCPRFSGDDHDFAATTHPTAAEVGTFLDQMAGLINSVLAEEGFATPLSSPDTVKDALDGFANQEVAAIVNGLNGSGRFGPSSKSVQKTGLFGLVLEDVRSYITGSVAGFVNLGANRERDSAEQIGARLTDEAGDDVHPIFQRKAFGNRFTDWDS